MKHVQCRLKKGTTLMTAWIPKAIAVKGGTVDLGDPANGEENGWEVIAVGTYEVDSKWASERSRDHLNQRSMSDI